MHGKKKTKVVHGGELFTHLRLGSEFFQGFSRETLFVGPFFLRFAGQFFFFIFAFRGTKSRDKPREIPTLLAEGEEVYGRAV